MTQPDQERFPLEPLDEFPRPRGRPVIAWLVVVAVLFGAAALRRADPAESSPPDAEDRAGGVVLEIIARSVLGVASLTGERDATVLEQLHWLDSGAVGQRLRYTTLVGELAGPKQALEQLDHLDVRLAKQSVSLTGRQASVREILRRLYGDYRIGEWVAPSLGDADRIRLHDELGWFAELALAPAEGPNHALRDWVIGRAQRTVFALAGMMLWFLVLGLVGLATLVVLTTFLVLGRLRGGLETGVGHGGIYGETFAVWLAGTLGLSVLAERVPLGESRPLALAGAILGSLAVLIWPVLRGIPWRQVRQDIGLTVGRSLALEPFYGLTCYAMVIPIAVAALAVSSFVLFDRLEPAPAGAGVEDFGPQRVPRHPIVESAGAPGWRGPLELLLLAAVVAPVVEETMFRGVLYRHLREASARLGMVLSVLASAFVNTLLFAVLHPQGPLFVPALMALACGFTLAREWRDSLVAAIMGHALNNGVVVAVLVASVR